VAEAILEARNITKTLPGCGALEEVSLVVANGAVHAIVGESGAGKRSRVMIVGGVFSPGSGEIRRNGDPVRFSAATEANRQRISAFYQNLSVASYLGVAESIFAHRAPIWGLSLINWDALYKRTTQILRRFELDDINPRTPLADLSVAKRQVVEVPKATAVNPNILLFDEPAPSLTEIETKEPFESIPRLRTVGISIICAIILINVDGCSSSTA
jgi:ABC-type sugar transport system ATPase subunit